MLLSAYKLFCRQFLVSCFKLLRYYTDCALLHNISMMTYQKTAGLIVIGDEILRGQTVDTNSSLLCSTMYKMRIPVNRIVVIPDVVQSIADEVASFASTYDYVLTSGGVGPTHDDVTYEGIARAFDRNLVEHPVLVELINNYLGEREVHDPTSHPAFKMSRVPEGSRVLYDQREHTGFPLVAIENVFMFPGIPKYMEQCLDYLRHELSPHSTVPLHFHSIYLNVDELSVTKTLNEAVEHFEGRVTFGSYPNVSNNYYKVQITMESDENGVAGAEDFLRRLLPDDAIVPYDSKAALSSDHLYCHLVNGHDTIPRLSDAIHLIEECLCERFSPSEVCISFNGGKDCTALLHLYHTVLQRKFPERNDKIVAFYVQCSHSFPEVEQFVRETVIKYNMDLCKVSGPIKTGLEQFLSSRPQIKAILMGNRRTDPHSEHLRPFQDTDPGWPHVTRVFPLLDWSFSGIWKFLRHFYIPYCSLYDRGYTSLGSRHNTDPNPNLEYIDEQGRVAYRPAYKLNNGEMERNGRH